MIATRVPLTSLLRLALGTALAAPVAAGNVHVVSPPGGGGTFTSLHAAVGAAQNGDIVLVRPGVYDGLQYPQEPLIIGKSLTVHGDTTAGGVVKLRFPIVAAPPDNNLPITLRSLVVDATGQFALAVGRSAFLAEYCDFTAAPGAWTCVTAPGGAFVRCTINGPGADPIAPGGTPGTGVDAQGGVGETLAFYMCTIRGGNGQDGSSFPSMKLPSPGREAIRSLIQGTILLDRCDLIGGDGGDGAAGPFGSCMAGQQAGPAIRFIDLGSGNPHPACLAISSTLQAGAQGNGALSCPAGPPASSIVGAEFAAFSTLSIPQHLLYTNSPVHAGDTLALAAHGVPGEIVYPLVGAGPSPLPFLSIASVLVPSLPLTILPPIQVGPGGSGVNNRVMPAALGTQGLSFTLQPLVISAAQASAILAHPTSIVLLSPGL